MRADDLKGIMVTSHVDAARYGVQREVPDGLSIRSAGESWLVSRAVGGARLEERTFSSENDACVYFLLRALQLFVRRSPTTDDRDGG